MSKDELVSWLESVSPQKSTEWSKWDELQYEAAYNLCENSGHTVTSDWLKSLKNRVLPQPKHEWKQENTDNLTDFENTMMHIGDSFFGENAGLDPNDTDTVKEQAELLLELAPSKEWSKEDDYNLQCMIAKAVKDIQNGTVGRNNELIYWLKSIKQRIVGNV